MGDFDFWRLGKFSEIDQKEMEKYVARNFKANTSACNQFIEGLKKMESKRHLFDQKVQTLFQKIT
jgi:hypothetical protein